MNNNRIPTWLLLFAALFLSINALGQAATDQKATLRKQALDLAAQNRYLDAFPLLEKVAPFFPNDAEVWAQYGIAIVTRTATMVSPDERRAELIKGYNVLVKAKQLGTNNTVALNFLDQLNADGSGSDNFSMDPKVEAYLREGEGFFGRGEYDKAFASYEKAYKVNPKSYEAALFMGDSLYGAKKYKDSEVWFAKAVEIDPDREQAYRYWGDALMMQDKKREAGDKFIDALVSDPFSRMTWDRLGRWVEESGVNTNSLAVTPPGNELVGTIVIDEKQLKTDDGTIAWKNYNDVRRAQVVSAGSEKRTLAGEVAAFTKVAAVFRSDIKAGKLKTPDPGLSNLLKLDEAGLLEPYILLLRSDDDLSDEYSGYRQKNREKLKRFISEFLIGLPR